MTIFDAFKKLGSSITGTDFYILIAVIICLFIFGWLCLFNSWVKKDLNKIIKEKNKLYAKRLNLMGKIYSIFVAMISIFPLLGMFGTVCGLLGLDLAAGDMENIKNNFFMALTSTAWGIICSVVFKLVHAWVVDDFEHSIKLIKTVNDDLNIAK